MSRLSQSPLPTLPGGDCGLRAVDSVEHVLGHVGGVGRVDDAGRLVELHLGLEVVVLALHVDDHRVEEVDLGGQFNRLYIRRQTETELQGGAGGLAAGLG